MIVNFDEFLNERHRKTEKVAIVDKYKEYKDKILSKKEELQELYRMEGSSEVKTIRIDLKKTEIAMAEKELEIVRLRDQKLRYGIYLKNALRRKKGKRKK